jgi:hypothetical protein
MSAALIGPSGLAIWFLLVTGPRSMWTSPSDGVGKVQALITAIVLGTATALLCSVNDLTSHENQGAHVNIRAKIGFSLTVFLGLLTNCNSQVLNAGENIVLDSALESTSGLLKWSHGGFLYVIPNQVQHRPPTFHSLDRSGKIVSTVDLQLPDSADTWFGGFDKANDGTIAFAGGTYSVDGKGAPLIALLSAETKAEQIIRTYPYYPHMIGFADDGSLWTLGCEMVNKSTSAPGLNLQAGVLRHFDKNGKLIASFLPQLEFVQNHDTTRLQAGHLSVSHDKIG